MKRNPVFKEVTVTVESDVTWKVEGHGKRGQYVPTFVLEGAGGRVYVRFNESNGKWELHGLLGSVLPVAGAPRDGFNAAHLRTVIKRASRVLIRTLLDREVLDLIGG